MTRRYRYSHLVGLDETNVVGNVYFAHYLRWQGHCRERFLNDHAPDVLATVTKGELALITLDCSMTYITQSFAFDRIDVCMALASLQSSRVEMVFEFEREGNTIARGVQSIACMMPSPEGLVPVAVPDQFRQALEQYRPDR